MHAECKQIATIWCMMQDRHTQTPYFVTNPGAQNGAKKHF